MKSKTSCFNLTIFKKNITHFWPVWMAYLAYLFITEPAVIWQKATREWYWEAFTESQRMYTIVSETIDIMIMPSLTFIFAAVMALAVFSYLYSAKNANMMHALPVNRLELFVTNYVSGLMFLLIPQIIAFFAAVLVCMGNQVTCIQYLFYGLLCQMGIAFFAYSLAVFVAMFTGQMLAMPIYFLVINFLYIACCYIVNLLTELLCYGITGRWNPGRMAILSPLYYLQSTVRGVDVYNQKTNMLEGIKLTGTDAVVIYAVAAVFITIAAYCVYRKRQIETAGDWISVGFMKPVFRWGFSLCGGSFIALFLVYMMKESIDIDAYIVTILLAIVMGFVCFFTAEMLIRKQFRVFEKKRLQEWCLAALVMGIFITLFKVDAFGIERHIPSTDEISAAYVNMHYPVRLEGEEVEQLREVQKDVIAKKKEYQVLEAGNKGYYYTTFRYYLKDGTTFERQYPVAVTEEYQKDETSPVSRILAWERDTENLTKEILGSNYDNREYIEGDVDVYNDTMTYREHIFYASEAELLAQAVRKDIEAGNYDAYYAGNFEDISEQAYVNAIYLRYYNRSGNDDMWDYYSGRLSDEGDTIYEGGESVEGETLYSKSIKFGKGCDNTIQTLKELELIDDTWKLWTQKERSEYMEE